MDEEVQAARRGHSAGGSQPPQLMPCGSPATGQHQLHRYGVKMLVDDASLKAFPTEAPDSVE